MDNHDAQTRRLLEAVASGQVGSQRSLASDVGIALGLTNLLLKRVVKNGWVRVSHISRNRVRYLITPAGLAEKARMTRAYLGYSIRYYIDARSRISEQLATLSWQLGTESPGARKRVVFLGSGEIAEIGFVCLQETDLELVGIVDGTARGSFFGRRVCPPATLGCGTLDGTEFDRVVVMDLERLRECRQLLRAQQVPAEQVFWI